LVTCYLKYVVNPQKLKEFESYGKMWIPLVEKFGGIHHGKGVKSSKMTFAPVGKINVTVVGLTLCDPKPRLVRYNVRFHERRLSFWSLAISNT
jgi:hypothetical protein